MIYLCSMILFYACILNRNQLIKVHFYKSSYPHLPKLKGKNEIFGRLPEVKPKFPELLQSDLEIKVNFFACVKYFFFYAFTSVLNKKGHELNRFFLWVS